MFRSIHVKLREVESRSGEIGSFSGWVFILFFFKVGVTSSMGLENQFNSVSFPPTDTTYQGVLRYGLVATRTPLVGNR